MGMKKGLTTTSGHLDNWPELFKWMRGGVQNSGGTSDQSKILIFSTVLRHGTAQRIDPHRSVSRNLLILAMSVPIDRSHLLCWRINMSDHLPSNQLIMSAVGSSNSFLWKSHVEGKSLDSAEERINSPQKIRQELYGKRMGQGE